MKRSEPWPEVTQEPIIHVDATPDGGYALRILQTYRENCNCRWEATPGNPLVDKMNADCEKRAMELDAAIAKLRAPDPDPLAERDKLREALRLMLVAIPDGWEVPLLYGQIVAQCRAVLEESSICRGLAQQGTIDRGSFAQYADDESTVTTSPETRVALAESAKQMEEKP